MNLGGGRGVGSISSSGSDPTRKPGDAESEEFPVGLRVLVVDDDPTCLKILERMLVTCRYEVTKCNRVEYALNELRSNKNGFDVVISDVHMPNMDGFKLLEYVGLEMDLPVIMMSADDSKNVVMKGVKHGACDYLIKPVRMDALKNIWQHVVRRKKNEQHEFEPLNRGQKHDKNEENWKSLKRKGDEEEADDKDDYAYFKKHRVVWSVELHQQFVAAVNHLGIDSKQNTRSFFIPSSSLSCSIAYIMLNKLHHLVYISDANGTMNRNRQKYRLCLRKLTGESHQFGGMNNFFMGPPNSTFGTMASLGGIDLQTLTGYQPTLASISMPVHQTNALGYQTTNSLSELQQLSNTNNHSAYLPHGMTSFYQSAPLWSNGALVGALPRNGLADNDPRMAYTSLPQPSHMVDLSVNHVSDLRSSVKEGVSLDKKLSREFDPTYDTFNDLSQQTPQDWQPGSLSSVGIQENSFLENITASTLEHHQGGNIKSGNNLVVDNISSTVTPVETVQEASSASNHYNFEFDQDDLFSVMLSQQEEDIRPVDGEFKLDAYALEDLL
ncbi:hypothetical protein V2J09_011410 [Rumex salicifolius]